MDGPAAALGVDLLESLLAVASVTTRALRTRLLAQSCDGERFGRGTTHLAALHDSIISSNAATGRSCPSFALFLQTGHSCFEVMEFLMHCTPSVVIKSGLLSNHADPPASRSSAHMTRKPGPYRTLCISCMSTRSRDAPVRFAESLRDLKCLNPATFAGDSSSTSSQKGRRARRVRVTIVLNWDVDASGKLGVTCVHPRSRAYGHTCLSHNPRGGLRDARIES